MFYDINYLDFLTYNNVLKQLNTYHFRNEKPNFPTAEDSYLKILNYLL